VSQIQTSFSPYVLARADPLHPLQELQSLTASLLPHLTSRQHQVVQEFSFWPSSPPRDAGYTDGGVFEMRTYELMPGKLLEWEGAWRRGLEARRRFVVSRGEARSASDKARPRPRPYESHASQGPSEPMRDDVMCLEARLIADTTRSNPSALSSPRSASYTKCTTSGSTRE
jgi:hypothetical protein